MEMPYVLEFPASQRPSTRGKIYQGFSGETLGQVVQEYYDMFGVYPKRAFKVNGPRKKIFTWLFDLPGEESDQWS